MENNIVVNLPRGCFSGSEIIVYNPSFVAAPFAVNFWCVTCVKRDSSLPVEVSRQKEGGNRLLKTVLDKDATDRCAEKASHNN